MNLVTKDRSLDRVAGLPRGLVVLGLLVSMLGAVGAGRTAAQADATGVTTLTGSVTVTNPYILGAYLENYVALIDMTGFVKRDRELPLPDFTQVTTGLVGDWGQGATFTLPLPIAPRGTINDVGRGEGGSGVQVYSVDAQANVEGDPYLGPDEYVGWSTELTSLATTVDTGEVTGGRLVVWAPDAAQRFPTEFGPDGLLFTADDPLGPIAAGWTVVDLDARPFAQLREPTVDVPIIEGDAGLKDLSNLTYTQAFDQLITELRRRYPFTGFKQLDWNAIVAEVRPRVEQAERDGDPLAFNLAIVRLTQLMKDGHVSVSLPGEYLSQQFGGQLGLYLGITDDDRIVLRCVSAGSPGANAGLQPAAEILTWNEQPAADAVAAVEPISSHSNDQGRTLERLSLVQRMPVGTKVAISYRNPGAAEPQTAELAAVPESPGDGAGPCGQETDDPAEMPVIVEVLPSGLGYIQVNTFADDLLLMTHAWEWALRRLAGLGVPGLIIDVRLNGGGSGQTALSFAGSFYDQPFVLNEAILIDEAGTTIAVGEERVTPSPVRWERPVAVLINPGCASACEIFAAAMARDPRHLIVGRTPSAGVEAGVLPWLLPDRLYFQAPVVALRNPDGSIFLEGVGVIPNVPVPNTPENLLLGPGEDAALDLAVKAVQDQIGGAPPPAAGTPPPSAG